MLLNAPADALYQGWQFSGEDQKQTRRPLQICHSQRQVQVQGVSTSSILMAIPVCACDSTAYGHLSLACSPVLRPPRHMAVAVPDVTGINLVVASRLYRHEGNRFLSSLPLSVEHPLKESLDAAAVTSCAKMMPMITLFQFKPGIHLNHCSNDWSTAQTLLSSSWNGAWTRCVQRYIYKIHIHQQANAWCCSTRAIARLISGSAINIIGDLIVDEAEREKRLKSGVIIHVLCIPDRPWLSLCYEGHWFTDLDLCMFCIHLVDLWVDL